LANLRRATVDRLNFSVSDLDDRDLALIVNMMFLSILNRPPEPTSLASYTEHLRKGLSLEDFRASLAGSEEARGVFVPPGTRQTMLLGTDFVLTQDIWDQRVAKIQPASAGSSPKSATAFVHSGQYAVSAIASIYKARKYLERFLENITSQTLFDRSELIIVDADSPEGEEEIIKKYQERFPNIVYRRINYRIGIYDAWNFGVGLARGKYLTNTNVDDLRRSDSFELQATALDTHPEADVVYQNVYYTFDPHLSFEQIAEIGFKTDVPLVSPSNLISFNSPHNAPMWRRELHSDVGLFDTAFKSAGDWEFWLRCLTHGKSFHRIDAPHVAYFHNPEGVSTRPDTRGIEEGYWVRLRYRQFLHNVS
jgi:GT2 family glycosyltransferase